MKGAEVKDSAGKAFFSVMQVMALVCNRLVWGEPFTA
jgi:hypothetical protein